MESSLATAILACTLFLSLVRTLRLQTISGVERISLMGLMVSNFWGMFKGSIKFSLWISPPNWVTYKMGCWGLLTKSPEPPIWRPNSHLAKAANSPLKLFCWIELFKIYILYSSSSQCLKIDQKLAFNIGSYVNLKTWSLLSNSVTRHSDNSILWPKSPPSYYLIRRYYIDTRVQK